MLTHHNVYDGEAIGRIRSATFAKETTAGKEGIVVVAEINAPDAIQKVLDKRYWTVSIGAETTSAVCSICGVNRVEEWCDHYKGQEYDGQMCYWIIGDMWFHELSFVNVPADPNAMIVDIGIEGLSEFADSKHAFRLQDSHMATKSYTAPKITTYEQQILNSGVKIDDFYNVIKTFRSTGASESEITERWNEIVELTKTEAREDKKMDYAELLKQVKSMAEEQLADFMQKETSDTNELKVQLSILKEAVVAESEKAKTVCAEIEALKATQEETNTALTTQEEQVKTLNTRIQEMEESLKSEKEENATILGENANLSAQLHKSIAERVVDLKIALGKPGVENKEDAIGQHVERKTESLFDSLEDLLKELKTVPTVSARPGTVKNPGLVDDGHQKNSTVEKAPNAPSTPKQMTDETVLKKLFNGKVSR